MILFLQKQWFLIGIAAASLLGYFYPEFGASVRDYDVVSLGVFLAFFATGLCLETRTILRQITSVRAPIAAVLSSLALYPVIAWLLSLPLLPYEFVIGVCIVGTGPVTVSSGTILTAIARGNVPLSILICISTSFLAIFTIPVILNVLLSVGTDIELPVLGMLKGLVLKVLVPIVMGQLLRPFLHIVVKRYDHQLSIFQSCIIVLIIFNVISSSAENITQAGTTIVGITLFLVCLHFLMLAVNYMIAGLIRLDRASTIAFTIHTSQKTLTVSYIVWAGYFSADYPMAFIPAIICQLIQMTAGTFVAEYFKKVH
jgi:sodium/bile acid cotransporter 7